MMCDSEIGWWCRCPCRARVRDHGVVDADAALHAGRLAEVVGRRRHQGGGAVRQAGGAERPGPGRGGLARHDLRRLPLISFSSTLATVPSVSPAVSVYGTDVPASTAPLPGEVMPTVGAALVVLVVPFWIVTGCVMVVVWPAALYATAFTVYAPSLYLVVSIQQPQPLSGLPSVLVPRR